MRRIEEIGRLDLVVRMATVEANLKEDDVRLWMQHCVDMDMLLKWKGESSLGAAIVDL